jgi:hypothetical protein
MSWRSGCARSQIGLWALPVGGVTIAGLGDRIEALEVLLSVLNGALKGPIENERERLATRHRIFVSQCIQIGVLQIVMTRH